MEVPADIRETARECRVIKRECGGWLAVSLPSCEIKIGITADTEEAASGQFTARIAEWRRSLMWDQRPAIRQS